MGDTATTILVEGEVFFYSSSRVAGKAAGITKPVGRYEDSVVLKEEFYGYRLLHL